MKQAYKKFLLPFEEFDRKLGCTMVAHPRANRIKGRSLLRANSVALPKPEKDVKTIASAASATEESENTSESSVDNSRSKLKVPPPVEAVRNASHIVHKTYKFEAVRNASHIITITTDISYR